MQLSLLLAVVATIIISENAPSEPVGAASVRLTMALGAACRWYCSPLSGR